MAEGIRDLANHLIAHYPGLIPDDEDALLALSYLNKWDGTLKNSSPYAPLARVVRSVARGSKLFQQTSMGNDFASTIPYLRFLFEEQDELVVPVEHLSDSVGWVFSAVLHKTWEVVNATPNEDALGFGDDPAAWNDYAKKSVTVRYVLGVTLPESIDPAFDFEIEEVECINNLTLHSQRSNLYSQVTYLADMNATEIAISPGNSANPESPFFASEVASFVQNKISVVPMDRGLVKSNCLNQLSEQEQEAGCLEEKVFYGN